MQIILFGYCISHQPLLFANYLVTWLDLFNPWLCDDNVHSLISGVPCYLLRYELPPGERRVCNMQVA